MAKISNTKSNTLVSGTSDNDSIRNDGYNVTINGGDGDDTVRNYGSSVIIDGGAGNDSIYNNYESGGGGSGGGGSCVGTCVGVPSGVSNSVAESNCASVTIFGGTGNDYIYNVKEGYNSAIYGGEGDDTVRNDGDNVTITGGKGNDSIKIYGNNNLVKYSEGDGSDKIIGFRADSTLQIAGGSYSTAQSGKNIIVTVGDEKISLIGAASLSSINIEVNKLWSLDNDSKSNVTLGAEIVTATAFVRTKAINIVGNALDNVIAGSWGNDKLYGQNGNDTLWGGAGNDTLSGGNGDDLFVYTAGNDVITDYTEDSDKISISAAISKSSIKGSDATFTIGKNTLTVKDGFRKEITFIDAKGNERTIIGGAYLANNSSSAKSTLSAWREVADASERTKAIKITGNALDNSILGGSGKDSLYGADGNDYLAGGSGNDKLYGQNGNDTLWGGMGNDTLKGGDGADVFIYESGEGKDVISGFENNDMLLITGAFSASYDATKNSIAFKVDSTANALTIKDFTATTFNINGKKYKISGSTLVKK